MNKLEYTINQFRHSLGDVVDALREQTWAEKYLEDLHTGYLSNSDVLLGHVVRKMIDEEIYRAAEELCDE